MKEDLRNARGFRNQLTPGLLLALILLIGAALRFHNLGAKSYWIDEMSTVIEGQQSPQQLFASGRLDQPPAYYLPFHLWVQIFGTAEVSTRSFSCLFGIGSIVLIYLVGLELFGKPVGLLSAFLMAVSEFQLQFSQEARFYSFFEFMTLLSFLLFIRALRSRRKSYFVLYVLASIIMVLAHTYGVFILVAQNLFFFMQARKNKNAIAGWIGCQAVIGLALLSYLFPLLFSEGGIRGAVDLNIGGLSTPTMLAPLHSIYYFVFSPRGGRSWLIILVNYSAAGAVLGAGTWIYAIRQGKRKFLSTARGWVASLQEVPDVTSKLLLVSCWLVCPIGLPFIASLVIRPMYQNHYTIGAAPALYLLLASGMLSIRKIVPLVVSFTVLAVMIGPSLGYYYVADWNAEWREAATYVNENGEAGDVIVFAPNMGIGIQQKTFYWYYRGTLQSCGLGSDLSDSAVWVTLKTCVSGYERVWVIVSPTDDSTGIRYATFFLDPHQDFLYLMREQPFFGLSVYLFELKK